MALCISLRRRRLKRVAVALKPLSNASVPQLHHANSMRSIGI